MKPATLIPLIWLMCVPIFGGCANCKSGTGQRVEKQISIEDFSRLIVNANAEIDVYFDSTLAAPKLTVSCFENLFELLQFETGGDVLKIETSKCTKSNDDIKIVLTVATLQEVEMFVGELNMINTLRTNQFMLSVIGAGDVDLNLDVRECSVKINGAGDVDMTGHTNRLSLNINGAGDVNAKDLQSIDVQLEINGAGDVNLTAIENLNVQINGAGDVTYYGNPQLSQKISGAGDIKQGKP